MKLDGISPMKSDSNVSGGSISRGTAKDRVVINVGGYRHETLLSTLKVVPDSRLGWIGENASKAEYDPETNELFFDRHPGAFANILNYYRTGKLHCPGDVCGPLFEEELAFWGIEELQMEPCCWSNYTQHRDAQATLKAFEGLKKDDEDSENEQRHGLGEMRRVNKSKIRMKQMWALLEQPYSSKYAQILAMISLVIIVLSVSTFCIESIPNFKGKPLFKYLEYLYCGWFTVEFVARTIVCPNKIEYLKNFMTWVDILSVIPLYVSFLTEQQNLDFLFVIRLVRIFRLFRFFRTMSGMQVIGHTLRASARELFLLVLILLIPMVIFSTLIFYAEQMDKEKRRKSTFTSIPDAFWWAIITMTTVGYGDVVPHSPIGKIIGTICACIGVLIVALPVSVIGSNFTLFYSHAQAQLKLPKKKCKPLLLGAAGVLVSETTLNQDDDESQRGNDDGGTLKPSAFQSRGSTTEFKHFRNPSIIPRTRPARRQGRGNIDIPAFPFPMSKIESDISDNDSNRNTRSQVLSPDTSGSMTNISNGLRGISEVMLQITAPVTRRMAISPCPTPPNKRNGRKKRRLKRSASGNEESSSHERESFYTTDADSANEGNNHQIALEELKDKMRAQAQHSVSDSSNCNPQSSKENITSGEENPYSPKHGTNDTHLAKPKESQITKSCSHISLEAITIKPETYDPGGGGGGSRGQSPRQQSSSKGFHNEPLRNPREKLEKLAKTHISREEITTGSDAGDPGEGRHEQSPRPPEISDKQKEPDTWVKQPKVNRPRSRGYNCRRSPVCCDENRSGDEYFRNDGAGLLTSPSPVGVGDGKNLSCDGSFNELKLRNTIGLNHRRTSSEINLACGHNLAKSNSVSRSLDRLSNETCRRVNDERSTSHEFGPETRRVQFIQNTIV